MERNEPKKKLRAVGYTLDIPAGSNARTEALRHHIETRDWTLDAIVTDSSPYSSEASLWKVLERLVAREIDVVVVYRWKELARSFAELAPLVVRFWSEWASRKLLLLPASVHEAHLAMAGSEVHDAGVISVLGDEDELVTRSELITVHGPVPPADRFKEEILDRGRPVLFKGAIASWPATKWTEEHIRAKWGDLTLPVEIWPDPEKPYSHFDKTRYRETMSVNTFFDRIAEDDPSKRYYLERIDLGTFPGAAEDVRLEHFVDCAKACAAPETHSYLWFGPAKTVASLHFDYSANLFAQLRGKKRMRIFSPEQFSMIYFPMVSDLRDTFSPLDVRYPSAEKFPLFKDACCLDILVEEGDVLFIPSGWWHHVMSVTPSVSLNTWFDVPDVIAVVQAAMSGFDGSEWAQLDTL